MITFAGTLTDHAADGGGKTHGGPPQVPGGVHGALPPLQGRSRAKM